MGQCKTQKERKNSEWMMIRGEIQAAISSLADHVLNDLYFPKVSTSKSRSLVDALFEDPPLPKCCGQRRNWSRSGFRAVLQQAYCNLQNEIFNLRKENLYFGMNSKSLSAI